MVGVGSEVRVISSSCGRLAAGADFSSMPDEDVKDCSLPLSDGRTTAWTDIGPVDGTPVLRFPGTPGSRWVIRADRSPWRDRRLRMITGERPGFGRSTPLPGRGFAEHADDQARLLDHLGLGRVFVYGASGAAPHILAFAGRHPDRVRAVTIVAGAAPITADEAEQIIPINQRGHQLAADKDIAGLRALLTPVAEAMMADPLAGFKAQMATAPPQDFDVMNDDRWQETFTRATREALGAGIQGWIDETLALGGDWTDVPVGAVSTSVTWFHTPGDRNAPLSAARRVVDSLPRARLVVWPDGGHLAAYHREGEILDELLTR